MKRPLAARLKRSFTKRSNRVLRAIGSTIYGHMQPECIVIGTQKGGTTALHKYLSQHPSIVPAIKKEMHFFNCDNAYNKGLDYYRHFFEAATPNRANKIAIDVTPDYLFFSYKTAERIYQFNPSIKLIALLRDPIKRAYSAWQMFKRIHEKNPLFYRNWNCNCGLDEKLKNLVPRPSFGESFLKDIEFELELLQKGLSPEMAVLNYGFYADQLETYFRVFNPNQLLIIQSEAMREHTQHYLSKIETHLNIAPHNWAASDIQPHYEGNYAQRMSTQEISILQQLYKPHNEKLFDLIHDRFDWL